MLETLSKSVLFKDIKDKDIKLLLESITYQFKEFDQGDLIYSRGEEMQSLAIILDGKVKGEMLDVAGKVLKIEELEPARPIAPAFVFGNNNIFPVDVIAMKKTRLLVIPKYSLLQLMNKNEIFLKNFLDSISNRSQFLTRRLYFLSFNTIKQKLADYILTLAKPYKTEVLLPQSHQSMADLFGVTRPSLSRALVELENMGAISADRKLITIKNRDKLLDLLNQ